MPSKVSMHKLSGAAVTSAPHTAWSKPPSRNGDSASSLGVAPRPVSAVVAEGDRLGQGDVQATGTGDRGRDLRHLEGVGESRPLVVRREDEHLRLAGEAPEGRRMEDPVAVALEAGPPRVRLLLELSPTGPRRAASLPGASDQSSAASRDSRSRTPRPPCSGTGG